MQKTWLITGCSTGFGRELAKQVLDLGYRAIVASRNVDDVKDIVANFPETALSVELDVTNPEQISKAVKAGVDKFGRIDVLVNNAGIGYFGAVEESEDDALRNMFEINFFGLTKVIQAVLPIMRQQKSGHILNVASIAGLIGYPGIGFYNATKFAVDGMSEALSKEVTPLGIKVTIISPSGFRTDWAGRSAAETQISIADYAETAHANTQNIRNSSGKQSGDPVRAAKAIIKAVESTNPPLHLLLGAAALKNARIKLEDLRRDFDQWAEVSVAADFPKNA